MQCVICYMYNPAIQPHDNAARYSRSKTMSVVPKLRYHDKRDRKAIDMKSLYKENQKKNGSR